KVVAENSHLRNPLTTLALDFVAELVAILLTCINNKAPCKTIKALNQGIELVNDIVQQSPVNLERPFHNVNCSVFLLFVALPRFPNFRRQLNSFIDLSKL